MGFGTVHKVRSEDWWHNILEGAAPLAGVYETREGAGEAGRGQAQSLQTEHVINSEDGTIVERCSHCADQGRMAG